MIVMAPIMTRLFLGRAAFLVLLAAILTLSSCERQEITERREASPEPKELMVQADDKLLRIVVLGDSLSAGLGLAENEAFPAQLQDLLRAEGFPVQVQNAGVSGDTSAGGLSRLDWVLSQQTSVLVVELGGNDALRGQPLENTEKNLSAIVRRGQAAGARVLLLGMDVPRNYGPDYATRFSEMYGRIASSEGVALVPGFVHELGSDPALLQSDGLHPTTEGQKRLALKVLPHVRATLRDLQESKEAEDLHVSP